MSKRRTQFEGMLVNPLNGETLKGTGYDERSFEGGKLSRQMSWDSRSGCVSGVVGRPPPRTVRSE